MDLEEEVKKCGHCGACKRAYCLTCIWCKEYISGKGRRFCVKKVCGNLIDDNHCGQCSVCYDMPRFGGEGRGNMVCLHTKLLAKNSPKASPNKSPHHGNTSRLQGNKSPICGKEAMKKVMTEVPSQINSDPVERTPPVVKDVRLPRLTLNAMTKDELKEFIPRLLKLVTGRDEVFHGRRSARPEWWPSDVHWSVSRSDWAHVKLWTDNLRDIVKSCYKHMKQEHLLSPSSTGGTYRQTAPLSRDIQEDPVLVNTGPFPSSPIKLRMFQNGTHLPFVTEIFICFFCEKEFLSKEKMRRHQKTCTERPPELRKFSPEPAESTPSEPPQMSPKKTRLVHGVYPSMPIVDFLKDIDLVPHKIAEKLKERKCHLEIDCKIDDFEPVSPISPVTPRTPTTLISQLSHEDSGSFARKRLSYSISIEHNKADHSDKQDGKDNETDTDSDAESVEASIPKPKELNLLTIPLSSLLGQRIRKHIHVDTFMSVVNNQESFCKTPVKNSFLEKLRRKGPAYPVMYKPRWMAALHKENHKYKFMKNDVKEFICKFDTGLNCKTYKQVKGMKRARVVVEKTAKATLLRWVSKKVLDQIMRKDQNKLYKTQILDDSVCEFPPGPTLLAKNIDKLLGLKRRSSTTDRQNSLNASLNLSNIVSEEIELEVSNQKLTLYRSLLYEMSVRTANVVEDVSKTKEGEKLLAKPIKDTGGFKHMPAPLKYRTSLKKEAPVLPKAVMHSVAHRKATDVSDGDVNREKSVLRTMLMKSKQERLFEETVDRERKLKVRAAAVVVPANSCMFTPTFSVMKNSEEDVHSLHSGDKLTRSPSTRAVRSLTHQNQISPDTSLCPPVVRSTISKMRTEDKSLSPPTMRSAKLAEHSSTGLEKSCSTPVVHAMSARRTADMNSRLPVSMEKGSSPDDGISILSLSSDGESYHSECCLNCASKKGTPSVTVVGQCCPKYVDSLPQSGLATLQGGDVEQSEQLLQPLLQPLSVKIADTIPQDDILSPRLYEMPSPVSLTNESPNSPTLVHQTEFSTPVKRTSSQVSPKKLSPNKLSKTGKQLSPSVLSEKLDSAVKNKLSDTVKGGIMTRAKSLTPSVSPIKKSLRAFSSLSNTPVKSLPSSAIAKLDKGDLRQSKSFPQSCNNPYSLNSGNFITFLDSRNLKADKEKCLTEVAKQSHLSDGKGSNSVESSRKSKRLATSPLEGGPYSKLRKVLTEIL